MKEEKSKARVTGLRSKYSLGQSELARLASVNIKISILGEKVFRYVQDYQALWEFYSVVSEKWQIVKHIFGTDLIEKVRTQRKHCVELLDKYKNTRIERKVHNNLLAYRDMIDEAAQKSNLGFEVETRGTGNKLNSLIGD